MEKFFYWIKSNKLSTILLVVLIFFLYNNFQQSGLRYGFSNRGFSSDYMPMNDPGSFEKLSVDSTYESAIPVASDSVDSSIDLSSRKIIQSSSLSLVVKNVEESKQKVLDYANKIGGFMVNSSINRPSDQASATIVVRVPSEKLDEAIEAFKGISSKVVYESLSGYDVTDQYTDIQARMDTLQKTKVKFENILEDATKVTDILEVQRELISLQSQIDNLKGQQKYLDESSETVKISVYLSTDELSLPYTPDESWRPGVVLKEAVRSVILAFRSIADTIIWLVVYSVIWVPLLVVFFFFFKKRSNKRKKGVRNE